MKLLIGMVGKARSGKDTAANHLCDKHGFTRYALATPIKDFINELYGWGEREREGDRKEIVTEVAASTSRVYDLLMKHFGQYLQERGILAYDLAETWEAVLKANGAVVREGHRISTYRLSPRQAYQWFGTDLMRTHVHADVWLHHLDIFMEKHEWVVVSDVRFENEATYVRSKYYGRLLFVNRAGAASVNAHVSEAGVKFNVGMDHNIDNNGTIEDLQKQLNDIIYTVAVAVDSVDKTVERLTNTQPETHHPV